MSYRTTNGKVTYKGKSIKADPDTFEALTPKLAQDAKQVYFLGKVRALDRESFVILDDFFLKDDKTVYLQMETKLKATKWDPSTFQALGYGYGKDSNSTYWTTKKIAKADGGTLKPIAKDMAVDSTGYYFQNKRESKTKENHSSQVQVWLGENEYWVRLGPSIYYSSSYYYAEVVEIAGAHADSFRPLLGSFGTDQNKIYFEDFETDAPLDEDYQLVGESGQLLKGQSVCIFRSNLRTEIDIESLVACETYFLDKRHLYHLDGSIAGVLGSEQTPDLPQLLKLLFEQQWRILDSYHAVGANLDDENTTDVNLTDAPEVQGDYVNGRIELRIGEKTYPGSLANFPQLVSEIWSERKYGVSFVRYIHQSGSSYPRGDFQLEQLLNCGQQDLLKTLEQYEPEGLPILLAQVFQIWDEEKKTQLLTCLNCQSLSQFQEPLDDSSVTTNLARARELVKNNDLFGKSFFTRIISARLLYGLVNDTNKLKHFSKDILPSVKKAIESEASVSLRHLLVAIVDKFCSRLWVDMEVSDSCHYDIAIPWVNLLIKEKFNLDLNLARRCEIEWFQTQESATEIELKNLCKSSRMAPIWSGLHLDYPNAQSWLNAARIRVGAKLPAKTAKAYVLDLWQYFDSQRKECDEPYHMANLVSEMEDLFAKWSLEFPEIPRPKQRAYTSIDYIEYLVWKCPFESGTVEAQERTFVLEGWPWGRVVTAKLSIGNWRSEQQVALGIRSYLPSDAPQLGSGQQLSVTVV